MSSDSPLPWTDVRSLPADSVATHLGLTPARERHKWNCPVHGGSDSLHAYADGGFHCYGACQRQYSNVDLAAQLWGVTAAEACERLAVHFGLDRFLPPNAADDRRYTYVYTDNEDRPLYRVIRIERSGRGKQIFQERPDGYGGWIRGTSGVRRVPYRLSEVLRAAQSGGRVYHVEGEKKVELLREHGLTATCNAGGALKWDPTFGRYAQGAENIVLPDNDQPGFAHAHLVARSIPGSRLVLLPGLEAKGDIVDWLAAGHTIAELDALVTAHDSANAPPAPETLSLQSVASRLVVERASDVAPEDIRWLWSYRIPFGKLTVLEGDPGLAKSLLTIAVAAAVSTGDGSRLPDTPRLEAMDVFLITYEDGVADTIVPRLTAAGADLARVHLIRGVRTDTGTEDLFAFPDDIPDLAINVREHRAGLIVVDPLSASLSAQVDLWRDQHVRRALAPLARFAEEVGAAVLVVRHLTKGAGGRAIMAGSGSIGIGGAARSVLAVGESEENPERRILASVKCNIARRPPSLVYSVETASNGAPVIAWHGETSVTADDLALLRANDSSAGAGVTGHEIEQHLRGWLRDGDLEFKDIRRLAQEHGFAERSVRRAADRLGVRKIPTGFGARKKTVWRLDASIAAIAANGSHIETLAAMGRNGAGSDSDSRAQ